MVCPKCQRDNQEENPNCVFCGSPLTDENTTIKKVATKFKKGLRNIDIFGLGDIAIALVRVFSGLGFSIFALTIIFQVTKVVDKLLLIPFLICGIGVFYQGLERIIKMVNEVRIIKATREGEVEKAKMLTEKKNKYSIGNYIYHFGFFLFWFGFLTFVDYFAIKSWSTGGNQFFFFTILFWIVGIYFLLKKIGK